MMIQWGTWKSGTSLVHTGIRHPKSVMKNVIPVVMAGGTCVCWNTSNVERTPFMEECVCGCMFRHFHPFSFFPKTVIGIYGLIVGVILAQSIDVPSGSRENVYSIYSAMAHVSYFSLLVVPPSWGLSLSLSSFFFSLSHFLYTFCCCFCVCVCVPISNYIIPYYILYMHSWRQDCVVD
jgi:hypothetical protein